MPENDMKRPNTPYIIRSIFCFLGSGEVAHCVVKSIQNRIEFISFEVSTRWNTRKFSSDKLPTARAATFRASENERMRRNGIAEKIAKTRGRRWYSDDVWRL